MAQQDKEMIQGEAAGERLSDDDGTPALDQESVSNLSIICWNFESG